MPTLRGKVRGGKGPAGRGPAGLTLISLDFETYYDADYTLRKLSTSEYIRDKRFEALSVGIKIGDRPTRVYFGDNVAKALAAVNWRNTELLAHHTHFDGLILTHHYGHVPEIWRDTLSMGRGLHPKFERNDLATLALRYDVANKMAMPDFKGKRGKDLTPELKVLLEEYNKRDVDSMYELYQLMLPKMPADEMRLIDVTVRMFAEPVLRLDTKLAKEELKREIKEREDLMAESGVAEDVLSSNKKFPAALKLLGVDPPMKVSKTTGKPTYALSKADEDFTDLIAHPNEKVVALVRGRLAAKSTIGETRAARLIKSGSSGKRLPVYLNYCGAHTTRWSGGDKLNYQNLKKRGRIREAVMAPAGHQLVVIDSSQIEVRVLAWLAGETWLLDAFRDKQDPYCLFGTEVYGRTITKKDDPLERFISKSCVLGLGFQMGGPKLQVSILAQSIAQGLEPVRLDLPICYNLVNKYRSKNTNIKKLWEFMQSNVIAELAVGAKDDFKSHKGIDYGRGFVQLQGHLSLHYPEARADFSSGGRSAWSRGNSEVRVVEASYRTPKGRSKIYGGMMTENVVQYLARIIVAAQMLKIAERYRVVMMTHDEVVYLAKTKEAQAALDFGMQIMRTPPLWAPDLPVDASGAFAPVYSKED